LYKRICHHRAVIVDQRLPIQPAMPAQTLRATLARIAAAAAPVVATFALAACASAPMTAKAPAPVVTATSIPVAAGPGSAQAPSRPPVSTALAPAAMDPDSPLSQQRSVYFAFDESSFRAQDRAVVELQGRYLAQHPDVHASIAGNTDERGGSEYNLALGQRRAQSVKSALELLGVKDAQVEAVSYGKEKPRATGHDEAAWQQNRRADFLYPAK
jgi:peptidoglycan-associated lipoprotein